MLLLSSQTPLKRTMTAQLLLHKVKRKNFLQEKKKIFCCGNGELVLGIATRLIKSSSNNESSGSTIPVFERPRKRINGKELGNSERNDKERIGLVMEDKIEPEVIWEQRVKDIEAQKERRVVTSTGFSFSAAGLLFPYHLGVAHFLGLHKETTPFASTGFIVCAVIASGASMNEALQVTKILADDCRHKESAFCLGAVLRDIPDRFLPHDIHTRSNGILLLAQQQWNRLCIDGGLTLFMAPTSASKTVRVCAFSAGSLGFQGIGISPDCHPQNRATGRELFNWAIEPADDDILDRLYEIGYLDAAVWAEQNPVENIVADESPLVENSSAK